MDERTSPYDDEQIVDQLLPDTIEESYTQMVCRVTDEYLTQYVPVPTDFADPTYDPQSFDLELIESELIAATNKAITVRNLGPEDPDVDPSASLAKRFPHRHKGSSAWPYLRQLHVAQIATILKHIYPVRRVAMSGLSTPDRYDMLGIYQFSGPRTGLYDFSEQTLSNLVINFSRLYLKRDIEEVRNFLMCAVPRVERTNDPDFIPMNNGVFNYKTKQLQPFSPDLVITCKSQVDYIKGAKSPTLYYDDPLTGKTCEWDVESWMSSLSDDKDIVNLLWQICGAILRPFVSWDKAAWLYSTQGSNGKGTFCTLLRELCGEEAVASIPLSNLSKDFALEPLTSASAIIVDENDVGIYLDRVANLKAIITNDIIDINRKFRSPISYRFFGFMVQCLNEKPMTKDNSESFYRRQLFIPFDKRFLGREIKEIKRIFLRDPKVLQYVAYKVLHEMPDFYRLDEPDACVQALQEYKSDNDPLRQFFEDVEANCVWDFLPFDFLYILYKSWWKANVPSGRLLSAKKFVSDIKRIAESSTTFSCNPHQVRIGDQCERPEHMILRYDLKEFINQPFITVDPSKACSVDLKGQRRRGLTRNTPLTEDDIALRNSMGGTSL